MPACRQLASRQQQAAAGLGRAGPASERCQSLCACVPERAPAAATKAAKHWPAGRTHAPGPGGAARHARTGARARSLAHTHAHVLISPSLVRCLPPPPPSGAGNEARAHSRAAEPPATGSSSTTRSLLPLGRRRRGHAASASSRAHSAADRAAEHAPRAPFTLVSPDNLQLRSSASIESVHFVIE